MPYCGDYAPAKTVVFNFNTAAFSDGSPITLAGTPAISVYKNSTTESTAGVTLTVDYDSRTGMHHVVIDTSADGTFYAAANDFDVIITAGTVGGTSVVGRKVGSFSLHNRSTSPNAVIPTAPTAGTVGEAWLITDSLAVRRNTAQGGGAATITLDAGAASSANSYVGDLVVTLTGTGAGQARTGVAYNTGTKVLTVDRAWDTNPDNTSTFLIIKVPKADNYLWKSTQIPAPSITGRPIVDVQNWGGSVNGVFLSTNSLLPLVSMASISKITNGAESGDLTVANGVEITIGTFLGNGTAALVVDATGRVNITKINDHTVTGSGTLIDPWQGS